jgi:hypothetical protein
MTMGRLGQAKIKRIKDIPGVRWERPWVLWRWNHLFDCWVVGGGYRSASDARAAARRRQLEVIDDDA